jgi:hypothetical protein
MARYFVACIADATHVDVRLNDELVEFDENNDVKGYAFIHTTDKPNMQAVIVCDESWGWDYIDDEDFIENAWYIVHALWFRSAWCMDGTVSRGSLLDGDKYKALFDHLQSEEANETLTNIERTILCA